MLALGWYGLVLQQITFIGCDISVLVLQYNFLTAMHHIKHTHLPPFLLTTHVTISLPEKPLHKFLMGFLFSFLIVRKMICGHLVKYYFIQPSVNQEFPEVSCPKLTSPFFFLFYFSIFLMK